MPDKRRSSGGSGGRNGQRGGGHYSPPQGPSLSRLKDMMAHRARLLFWFLLVTIGVTSVLLFSGGGGLGGPNETAPALGTSAVATVNGDDITRAQLENAVSFVEQEQMQMGGGGGMANAAENHATALQTLIRQQVELQAARNSNVKVSDQEYQNELNRLVDRQYQTEVDSYQSKAAFEANLKSKGETEADARREARAHLLDRYDQLGMNLRNTIMDELKLQKFRDTIEHQLTLTRLVHYAHILIPTNGKNDAQQKTLADSVVAQLRGGADFSKLAKQHSSDTATSGKAGDAGWAPVVGSLVPEFLKGAVKAKPGDILGPTKTPGGFEIVKVLGFTDKMPANVHEPTSPTQFDQANSGILGAAEEAYQKYLDGLVSNAKVTYKDQGLEGAVLEHNGNRNGALADYQSALKSGHLSRDEKAWVAFAAAQLLMTGPKGKPGPAQMQEALSDYKMSLDGKASADAWIGAGDIQLKLNHKDAALADYKAAIRLAAGDNLTLASLAGKLHDLGDIRDAAAVSKMLRSSAGGPMGLGGLGAGGLGALGAGGSTGGPNIPIRINPSPAPAGAPAATGKSTPVASTPTPGSHPAVIGKPSTHSVQAHGSLPSTTPRSISGGPNGAR